MKFLLFALFSSLWFGCVGLGGGLVVETVEAKKIVTVEHFLSKLFKTVCEVEETIHGGQYQKLLAAVTNSRASQDSICPLFKDTDQYNDLDPNIAAVVCDFAAVVEPQQTHIIAAEDCSVSFYVGDYTNATQAQRLGLWLDFVIALQGELIGQYDLSTVAIGYRPAEIQPYVSLDVCRRSPHAWCDLGDGSSHSPLDCVHWAEYIAGSK